MDESKKMKLAEILASKGLSMNYQYGGNAPDEMVDREIKKEPAPRSKRLRDIFYNTLSTANMEFPYWYNRKWKELDGEVTIVRRAKALKEAFSHLTPNIIPGEKLVMQKTYNYRGSFPMPWLSESFFVAKESELYKAALESGSASAGELSEFGQGGGNVTKSFGNVVSIAGKFGMRKEEIPVLLKVANEWIGKSVEDIGHKYEKMVPDYKTKENIMRSLVCMFDSGFTLPQGREVINYYYPLQYGFDRLIEMAKECKDEVAGNAGGDGIIGMDRLYFYEAVIHSIEGIQNWILNYAKHARRLEKLAKNIEEKKEYADIANCLEWIAHNKPRTFREALQLSYTLHIAVVNEDAISGMSIGRLGQVLYPWYEQDIEAGRISRKEVLELLELYRIKITCIDCFASTGVVGGVLSGNTFNNLSLGGLTRDGQSATNDLEMLIVEAGITCQTPQPTLSVLYDERLPEKFLLKCAQCDKTGAGYPAWMNNRIGIEFITNQYGSEGMTIEEARSFAIGGCLETSPCCWKELTLNGKKYEIPGGAGQPTSVGVHFIANPKVLELVLTNGKDHRTGIQVFKPHNKELKTYEELFETFKEYYEKAVDVLSKTNNIQHDIWRKQNMAVINSFLKPDCLDKGHHIGNMGYRYNATYNVESCGTITMVNSLAAIKKIVYDDKKYSLEQIKDAVINNFGFKNALETRSFSLVDQEKSDTSGKYDDIYGECLTAPKYGNDDIYVDNILKEYEEWFCSMVRKPESLYAKPMYACQISVSTHGAQGAATLATPDGRLAGTTYADGSMSAYPGTDKNGPYALFESATVWDHSRSQNSQMNMKIHPSALKGEQGTKHLLELTRAYMRKGGFHIQYNIVDSKVLRDAQKNPNNYRDLMVRVAGFTQYWCEIGKPIQDEVIARTEYEGV
ncbi:4-hydroxyphenylacetate decarboxylase large subunit [Tepidibacter formicigenes]|jgi:4-hydroxyphenylacetate decarboxylase large subunit|uniref:4-hydroxyphenylacetate decarboxylase subunit B n=1 Tax=Tepidibacter formicigenes DSM 15518 TaxID=1123349 RepID=A0A1M6JR28_9FIRM|nr:4-hydroxyphenylacetate decarboxylase large subunit [Tepidibacter formicigenes]SHJ49225.1 4-hydroxyphenylacetate decarboxylase subunit B [Tepidibacter formicigenes DSM 15518]